MSALVLLSDAIDTAKQELEKLLKSPFVLFIILGNRENVEALSQTAERYGGSVEGWKVVRVKNDVVSTSIIQFLQGKPDPHQLLLAVNLDAVAAIVTSVNDEIRAVFKKPYSAISNVDLPLIHRKVQ